ncbi:MAG: citrate transporter [Candidatus Delongbacteria bacterium]|nr:citrate transporter [Candidatus Delongbacteria bacterium]
MEMIQFSLILSVFIIMALLMFFRRIPALLALPLMAFLMPLIAGVPLRVIIEAVIGEGAVKLYSAYTIAIFGSMLSILLQKTGVAEELVKKGAELAGDNPWVIGLIMLILITLLFTTLGGLGAIIMVAGVVLPVMSSAGLGAMTIVGIFLIGLSMGGILNVGNWAVYQQVMQLSVSEIMDFALPMFGLTLIMGIIYLSIQIYRDGYDFNFKKPLIGLMALAAVILVMVWLVPAGIRTGLSWILTAIRGIVTVTRWVMTGLMMIMPVAALLRMIRRPWLNSDRPSIHWTAYFTPVMPLLLILIFKMNFTAAFICGLVYGFISTYRPGHINLLIRSAFEGGGVVMPAVVLMFGIGMLLNAIMGPGHPMVDYPELSVWPVLTILKPVVVRILPESALGYVLTFWVVAPLALYRGPLNVWGMGYGLTAVLMAAGIQPGAVMGILMSVGQIQGISDPTNTHNVWLANEMQQNVQKILWNTLPYTWILALAGLIVSAVIYF